MFGKYAYHSPLIEIFVMRRLTKEAICRVRFLETDRARRYASFSSTDIEENNKRIKDNSRANLFDSCL